jgi:outer membrane murein-binding lipoprotein Lpp
MSDVVIAVCTLVIGSFLSAVLVWANSRSANSITSKLDTVSKEIQSAAIIYTRLETQLNAVIADKKATESWRTQTEITMRDVLSRLMMIEIVLKIRAHGSTESSSEALNR